MLTKPAKDNKAPAVKLASAEKHIFSPFSMARISDGLLPGRMAVEPFVVFSEVGSDYKGYTKKLNQLLDKYKLPILKIGVCICLITGLAF